MGESPYRDIDPGLSFPSAVGQPVSVYAGTQPNPHVAYGQADMTNAPVTFNRIGTRWGDVQLSNGWQCTNYGHRLTYNAAGYLIAVSQQQPGQTRLIGQRFADFPARGPSPSQWAFHVATGPGMQPDSPGGPGQAAGPIRNIVRGAGG